MGPCIECIRLRIGLRQPSLTFLMTIIAKLNSIGAMLSPLPNSKAEICIFTKHSWLGSYGAAGSNLTSLASCPLFRSWKIHFVVESIAFSIARHFSTRNPNSQPEFGVGHRRFAVAQMTILADLMLDLVIKLLLDTVPAVQSCAQWVRQIQWNLSNPTLIQGDEVLWD